MGVRTKAGNTPSQTPQKREYAPLDAEIDLAQWGEDPTGGSGLRSAARNGSPQLESSTSSRDREIVISQDASRGGVQPRTPVHANQQWRASWDERESAQAAADAAISVRSGGVT